MSTVQSAKERAEAIEAKSVKEFLEVEIPAFRDRVMAWEYGEEDDGVEAGVALPRLLKKFKFFTSRNEERLLDVLNEALDALEEMQIGMTSSGVAHVLDLFTRSDVQEIVMRQVLFHMYLFGAASDQAEAAALAMRHAAPLRYAIELLEEAGRNIGKEVRGGQLHEWTKIRLTAILKSMERLGLEIHCRTHADLKRLLETAKWVEPKTA
jgi:hypothetical protein